MIFLGIIVLVQGREIQKQELKRQVSDELKQQANVNRPQFQNTKGLTIEAKRGGQSLMKGHAYAQQANVGRVVLFCAEASSIIADAVNAATREALNKLTELMVNSSMLHDLGGLPSQKQAQAK